MPANSTKVVASTIFHPERERKMTFRGQEMSTADLKDGRGYIAVKSLCEVFGLDPRAQRKRLMRQQGYFAHFTATVLMTTPGGPQATLCLESSAVPIFLAGVELDRLQDEHSRELLRAFQTEAHTVLAEHFGLSERGEMNFLRNSIARMVVEQEAFEDGVAKKVEAELAEMRKSHDEKVQQIREAFANLRQQVTRIEAVAGPKARLNPEQLGQLRQMVATLGTLLQESGVSKPYPGIYMDITRLTGVSRSKDIRQEDFAEVVEFLEKQIGALTKRKPASGKSKSPAEDD